MSFDMEPTPPYDLSLTAGYVTHFEPRYAAESFEEGVHRGLLDLGRRVALAASECRSLTLSIVGQIGVQVARLLRGLAGPADRTGNLSLQPLRSKSTRGLVTSKSSYWLAVCHSHE